MKLEAATTTKSFAAAAGVFASTTSSSSGIAVFISPSSKKIFTTATTILLIFFVAASSLSSSFAIAAVADESHHDQDSFMNDIQDDDDYDYDIANNSPFFLPPQKNNIRQDEDAEEQSMLIPPVELLLWTTDAEDYYIDDLAAVVDDDEYESIILDSLQALVEISQTEDGGEVGISEDFDDRPLLPDDYDANNSRRKLVDENNVFNHGDQFHKSIACNDDDLLDEPEQDVCTKNSFRNLVETNDSSILEEVLVVPECECYIVDYTDGEVIELPSGLSINGKLYFPRDANVTLRTTFVWVKGILKIDNPDVGKKVTFSLYGDEEHTYKSFNHDCPLCKTSSDNSQDPVDGGDGGGGCNMGSKVIAVVGGRLDINGYDDDDNCPAWEKLNDIGTPKPRSFENHLPCSNSNDDDDTDSTSSCWENDTIRLSGPCRESAGHTQNLGKYTVHCPIHSKPLIKFGESLEGIKLTSVQRPEPTKFEYPKSDDNGKEVSLTINGNCGKAGHTNHFKRCVIQCPLKQTEVIKHGYDSSPLTFTSVSPVSSADTKEEEGLFKLPSVNNQEVQLRINGECWNSQGHTNAYKRCAVMCNIFDTVKYNGGSDQSSTKKLRFTSKYVENPIPFPIPKKDDVEAKFVLNGSCRYMAGHTDAWKGCVVRCPVERTRKDYGSFHKAARLNNQGTNGYVDVKRILQYAHGGIHMYLLLQDVSKDRCENDGADSLNDVFTMGDEIVPSYQTSTDPSYDGNTFQVDRVLHYSYNKRIFLFLPTTTAESDDTCDDSATDFSSKFPSGYEVDISYDTTSLEAAPPGDETFNVDKVHHWAWNGNRIYFFPEKKDVETCDETVSEFNQKFNKDYGIDVSKRQIESQLGQVVTASKGVLHWSWNENGFFFFPDESDEEINKKFLPEMTIKVDYLDATDIYDLRVSQEASRCWEPGTDLLLTSHTRSMKDRQIQTIVSSDTTGDGGGVITLSGPVKKPITKVDDENFAIEIASLNRRIVFEAENDSNDDKIGGHLIIHHTNAPQHIQGVEIRNFGQQGRLGRYPIHFHKCGDSSESVVKKNVVRNSNQRGYVTHMTNFVNFEENVAFDVTGHCYFIEDGRETGNTFRKNLGSGIHQMPSDKVDQLEAKSDREETDDNPSVFWISNPNNNFYGNVAAGGDGNGYWFETRESQRHVNLGAFVDNEVHSSRRWAFTTYSPGWRPNDVAVIKNLKAYRNPSWGAFLHVTQNLRFDGGLFADNSDKAVMISRGDDLVFDGTTFIGQTEFANKDCRKEKVAIHLDPVRLQETVLWNFSGNKKGTTVTGAKFQKWSQSDTNCPSDVATPLKFFSHQTFIKSYSAPHVFEDVQVDSDDYVVDASMPDSTIDDVQIEISSDKYNALMSDNDKSGFLISPKLEVMVPTDCKRYNDGLRFCPGTCIRTITVLAGNAPFMDRIDMVVRSKSGQDGDISSREIIVTKDVRGHPQPEPVANRFFSAYVVALPKGDYEIKFVDRSTDNNVLSWPRYAFLVTEAAPTSCEEYVVESDFTFVKPDPLPHRSDCDDLIFNGNFDEGKNGWYAFHHGVELEETGGVGGSPALRSTKALNTGNNIAQAIDGSCLEAGNEYDVSFTFKILSGSDANKPYIRLVSENFDTSNPARKVLTTTKVDVFRTSSSESEVLNDDWITISGVWVIDDVIAKADKHVFHVGGGNYEVIIDNVSIRLKRPSSAPTDAPSFKRTTSSLSSAPTSTGSVSVRRRQNF